MSDRLHSLDELRVRVTITRKATGQPLDLSAVPNSAFLALAGLPGKVGTAGSVTIVDAPNGVVDVVFAEGALRAPVTVAQLRLTIEGETQTVWSERYVVAPAVLAP